MEFLDWADIGREFMTILVVVDPIGSLPVFYFATSAVPHGLHRAFAIRAVMIATIVLLAFLVGGQFLLEALGLRFGSFQIAGGIVLFLFAMTMVFGDSKPAREIKEAEKEDVTTASRAALAGAVFPLAMPSIASPGAMLAIVVLTDNNKNSIPEQLITAIMLVLVMVVTLSLLLMAAKLKPVLGSTGASVISRVMGIILATIAVDAVLGGLETVGIVHLASMAAAG